MAKAEKIRVPEVFDVQLTLSDAEANALQDLCDRIGGPPTTRRRHFDAIRLALSGAGVSGHGTLDISQTHGVVYFE
jgi:hypothetical protein